MLGWHSMAWTDQTLSALHAPQIGKRRAIPPCGRQPSSQAIQADVTAPPKGQGVAYRRHASELCMMHGNALGCGAAWHSVNWIHALATRAALATPTCEAYSSDRAGRAPSTPQVSGSVPAGIGTAWQTFRAVWLSLMASAYRQTMLAWETGMDPPGGLLPPAQTHPGGSLASGLTHPAPSLIVGFNSVSPLMLFCVRFRMVRNSKSPQAAGREPERRLADKSLHRGALSRGEKVHNMHECMVGATVTATPSWSGPGRGKQAA